LWDGRAFFWSVFVWPFRFWDYLLENGFVPGPTSFGGYLRLKVRFVAEALLAYLPVVAVLVGGLALFLGRRGPAAFRAWTARRDVPVIAAWAVVLSNIAFFLLPTLSGVMQFSFVLPVATACSVTLGRECVPTLEDWAWSKAAVVGAAIALSLAGLAQRPPLSCSWRSPGPDVVVLGELGRKLRRWLPPDRYVVTFDPVLAANAERTVYPGFEFELYGFYPRWDTARAERFKLYNRSMLLEALVSPRTGAVILTGRRWQDRKGLGRILAPYREEIAAAIARRNDPITHVELPTCVGVGWVDVYGSHPASLDGKRPGGEGRELVRAVR